MKKHPRDRRAESSARSWRQWKEPQAREALAAFGRSGLSVEAFCRREGYSPARIRYWRERLGPEPKREPVSFVPVHLGEPGRRQIEIERGGVVVRVREDLPVERVAQLVSALAGAMELPC